MSGPRFGGPVAEATWREVIAREEAALNHPPPYAPRVPTPVRTRNSNLTTANMARFDAAVRGAEGPAQGHFGEGTDPATARDWRRGYYAAAAFSDYVLGELAKIPGLSCPKPEGAFYVFPVISAYYGKPGCDTTIAARVVRARFSHCALTKPRRCLCRNDNASWHCCARLE